MNALEYVRGLEYRISALEEANTDGLTLAEIEVVTPDVNAEETTDDTSTQEFEKNVLEGSDSVE